MITDAVSAPEEDSAGVGPETITPTKDDKPKVFKKKTKKVKVPIEVPLEPEVEEVPQEPAPAAEGDDPIDSAEEPIIEPVEKVKKEKIKVKRTIIPLTKIRPPSVETPDPIETDSAEDPQPD